MILQIYEEIYKRKTFTIPQIVDALMPEYGICGRDYIRKMVNQAVFKLVREGQVRKIGDDPVVFENLYPTTEDPVEVNSKICPVCGKKFYPRRGIQDKYCSRRCYEKAKTTRRKADTRKRVRAYMHSADEKAKNKGKKWTPLEDRLLERLLEEGKTHREIAEKLGRTVYSVRWRVQKLNLTGGVS